MPRILRIINRLNLGGPTYNVAYLTKYLQPEFDTLLVSGMKEDSEESSEFILHKLGLNAVYIPEMHRDINFLNDRIAYQKIKALIHEFKPDIVHTHAAKAGTIGRLAAINCKVPVIVHTFHGHVFHSYFSPLKTKLFIRIERFLARRSSGIVAISEKQKHELADIYRICEPGKINVIPLGFDLHRFAENQEQKRQEFRRRFNIGDDEVAIGIIGRLVPVKNHNLFLSAMRQVFQRASVKVKAFVIGDGESRLSAESFTKSIGLSVSSGIENLSADVIFTSWIKEIDVAYAGLDIVALTSLNEGTPVSLIEAQAAGRPVVSTNVGGIENIVSPGITALLCTGSPENLAENLILLAEDRALRERMSLAGRENVMHRFDYRRLAEDTKALYYRLMNRH